MRSFWLCSLLLLAGCDGPPVQPATRTVSPDGSRTGALCEAAGFPTRWDATIAQASRRYLPVAWRHLAPCGWRAQLAAESGLDERWCTTANPHGTSASCLAQVTDGAASDIARSSGITGSRTNPQVSIRMGAWYLASMRSKWSEPRSTSCRRTLAVASYHGGAGTLIAGQQRARAAGRTARCYDDGIAEYLPRHRPENRAYVHRVAQLQQEMSQ